MHCNTLQLHLCILSDLLCCSQRSGGWDDLVQFTRNAHCNVLEFTVKHCNALQRTATHCNALQRTASHWFRFYPIRQLQQRSSTTLEKSQKSEQQSSCCSNLVASSLCEFFPPKPRAWNNCKNSEKSAYPVNWIADGLCSNLNNWLRISPRVVRPGGI